MMTAQQSEVVAVQKEVAAVDTHLVEVLESQTEPLENFTQISEVKENFQKRMQNPNISKGG